MRWWLHRGPSLIILEQLLKFCPAHKYIRKLGWAGKLG